MQTTIHTIDKQQEFTVYSTENYVQYPITYSGIRSEKITESLCCTPETNAML